MRKLVTIIFLTFLLACSVSALSIKGISYGAGWDDEYKEVVKEYGWNLQTYPGSDGIKSIDITNNRAKTGKNSLAMNVDIPIFQNGEIYLDLSQQIFGLKAPVDLEYKKITAYVWVPSGAKGVSSFPNYIQLFVKDSNYKSYYGKAKNMASGWNKVALIPTTTAIKNSYMDPGFNPKDIKIIGVKIGVNYKPLKTTFYLNDFQIDDYGKIGFEPEVYESLDALDNTGAKYVAIIPTWYMDNKNSNNIHYVNGKSSTDEEIKNVILYAKKKGLKVMLKPHVDILDGSWRGSIEPSSTTEWFESYSDFILHFADMAEENNVKIFSIGTELKSLSNTEKEKWEDLIEETDAEFRGKIIYSANWDEYKNVVFWGNLDYIGIDAYFPLSDLENPDISQIENGWSPWMNEIESWLNSFHSKKKVIFTEIGYRNIDYAVKAPYDYTIDEEENQELQARAYKAFFNISKTRKWLSGVFWWAWRTEQSLPENDKTHSPQGKLAESVLREAF